MILVTKSRTAAHTSNLSTTEEAGGSQGKASLSYTHSECLSQNTEGLGAWPSERAPRGILGRAVEGGSDALIGNLCLLTLKVLAPSWNLIYQ